MPLTAFPSGRKSLLLLALAAAIIAAAWWWQRPPPDPVSNGQRLSEWIMANQPGAHGAENPKAELQAFGPAAVTWLAYTVEHGEHPYYGTGSQPFDKAPDWLRKWVPERWGGLRPGPEEDQRSYAAHALRWMGPAGAPAIPALARALKEENGNVAYFSAAALQSIGPSSWSVVSDALAHGSPSNRKDLVLFMDSHFQGTRHQMVRAIEALAKTCHDADPEVRADAAHAFEACRETEHWYFPAPKDTEKDDVLFEPAIPELARLLSDPDARVRRQAVDALIALRAKATPAVPALIALLDDESELLRVKALIVLFEADKVEKRSASRLRRMLDDPDKYCRREAKGTLQKFGLLPEEDASAGDPPDR